MWTIQLYTRDGGFVTTADIPPFQIPPEVIVWGARVFVRRTGAPKECYFEGMAYHVVSESR